MRNITIVGAGQSGLQLGLGLLQNGYRVRLITNRTAEDIATGKVMSSQFMFNDSLQAERDLGINFWEKECPNTDALGVTIAGPDGGKAVSWVYTLDKPGQAVDQRVKFPGWMKKFAERGGELVIHEAGVADLENYARSSDLVILAGGKGDIVKLFERDAERSPFDKPQRALALTYVTGLTPYAPTRVAFNIAPTVGEYFVFPSLTTTGPCEIMVFEGIPGGPMDCWDDVKTPEQHLERSLDILKKFYPWEYERSRNAKLTDPNGILAGRFPPTVRKPVARLPSGALILGMADAVVPQRSDHRARIEQRRQGGAHLSQAHPGQRQQAVRRRLDAADLRRLLGLCAVRHRLDQRHAAAAASACDQHSGRGAEQAEGGKGVRQRLRRSAHVLPVARRSGRSGEVHRRGVGYVIPGRDEVASPESITPDGAGPA